MTTKSDTIPIVYNGGCYGTFIEWCLSYFSGNGPGDLPFNSNGNSHRFKGNQLYHMEGWHNYLKSGRCDRFVRFHLNVNSTESVSENLIKVAGSAKKVIFLYAPVDSLLLETNNEFEKIYPEGWIRHFEQLLKADFANWNASSLDDMEIWELREFLSFYIVPHFKSKSVTKELLATGLPNVLVINIQNLIDIFEPTLRKMLDFCELPVVETDFEKVYDSWIVLQTHRNKDRLVAEIVQSTVRQEYYDWSSERLTIADEAIIQYQLRDLYNLELKCYNLNSFPTNTVALRELLFHV